MRCRSCREAPPKSSVRSALAGCTVGKVSSASRHVRHMGRSDPSSRARDTSGCRSSRQLRSHHRDPPEDLDPSALLPEFLSMRIPPRHQRMASGRFVELRGSTLLWDHALTSLGTIRRLRRSERSQRSLQRSARPRSCGDGQLRRRPAGEEAARHVFAKHDVEAAEFAVEAARRPGRPHEWHASPDDDGYRSRRGARLHAALRVRPRDREAPRRITRQQLDP